MLPSLGVKEGLSCVLFRAIAARKAPNLALPSLYDSVLSSVRFEIWLQIYLVEGNLC